MRFRVAKRVWTIVRPAVWWASVVPNANSRLTSPVTPRRAASAGDQPWLTAALYSVWRLRLFDPLPLLGAGGQAQLGPRRAISVPTWTRRAAWIWEGSEPRHEVRRPVPTRQQETENVSYDRSLGEIPQKRHVQFRK